MSAPRRRAERFGAARFLACLACSSRPPMRAFVLLLMARSNALAPGPPEHALEPARAAPGRMIVLARGRSGSTVLAETIATLASSDARSIGAEIFGENETSMAAVQNPVQVMEQWFAQQRDQQPSAQLVGFKWKPVAFSDAYNRAWDWVASHNVTVLWMTRNLLDVRISHAKHQAMPELGPHCRENETCVAEHRHPRLGLDQLVGLDTEYRSMSLVERLAEDKRLYETEVEALLRSKRVRFKHVRFEDLFESASSAEKPGFFVKLRSASEAALSEWNRVFAFLGLPSARTYGEILATADSQFASTTPATACDVLSDPDAVRRALQGSVFEELLPCSQIKAAHQMPEDGDFNWTAVNCARSNWTAVNCKRSEWTEAERGSFEISVTDGKANIDEESFQEDQDVLRHMGTNTNMCAIAADRERSNDDLRQWTRHHGGLNCYNGHGAPGGDGDPSCRSVSLEVCQRACVRTSWCHAIVVKLLDTHRGPHQLESCWFREMVEPAKCVNGTDFELFTVDAASETPQAQPSPSPSSSP